VYKISKVCYKGALEGIFMRSFILALSLLGSAAFADQCTYYIPQDKLHALSQNTQTEIQKKGYKFTYDHSSTSKVFDVVNGNTLYGGISIAFVLTIGRIKSLPYPGQGISDDSAGRRATATLPVCPPPVKSLCDKDSPYGC